MNDETTLQAAYLLHYTPWRDTSFIVDLFTLEHGRLGLVARGARSAKPRTRALYQPFRPLLVSWVGGGELRTLTGIEESGAALPLAGASLASGYYVNELVLRLLGKEQPQPELFAHYALALAELADAAAGASVEATLRRFELQLLETIGVLPDLARCTPDGSEVEPERRYRFHPASALAVPHGAASEAPGPALAIPKRPADDVVAEPELHADGVTRETGVDVGGRTLLDMAALDFGRERTLEEAKPLTRRLVAAQLGGQPLRSRSLFAALVPPPPPEATAGAVTVGGTGEDGGGSHRREAASDGIASDDESTPRAVADGIAGDEPGDAMADAAAGDAAGGARDGANDAATGGAVGGATDGVTDVTTVGAGAVADGSVRRTGGAS